MRTLICAILVLFLVGCENRALHDSEEFKPREIHENIEFHFDRIEVDGVEYLVLEKDNNNPHEGFGFMAFRANKLMEKQDTTLAYLKTVLEMQELIYSRLYNVSLAASKDISGNLLQENINAQMAELKKLQEMELSGTTEINAQDSINNQD